MVFSAMKYDGGFIFGVFKGFSKPFGFRITAAFL
jgi:hypothetical protein